MHFDNLEPGLPGNLNWWIVISLGSHEEWNAENPLHSTSKIQSKLQENLADFTKKIERLRVTFTANGKRQI